MKETMSQVLGTGTAPSKCSAPVSQSYWPEYDIGREREMVKVALQLCLWSSAVCWEMFQMNSFIQAFFNLVRCI